MNQREIKFRCWDKEYEEMYTSKHFSVSFDGKVKPDRRDSWKDDQFILEQFTGLKDKTGKEIYEGDVVRFDGHTNEDKFTAAIEFRDGKFCDSYYGWEIGKYREVIGNIHENPELVAEKES